MDPQYVGAVLEDIRRVGRATGADEAAEAMAAGMQARIDAVSQAAANAQTHPRVLHLEWIDPLMCGGHWVPEMVEIAGGVNCFGDKEKGSFKFEWAEVVDSKPDVIILMPCGFDVKRALEDVPCWRNRKAGHCCLRSSITEFTLSMLAPIPAGRVPDWWTVWKSWLR